MGISGDFAGLSALQGKLREAELRGLLPKIAQISAARVLKFVADEFKDSHNPYGEAWAPLAAKRNRPRDRRASRAKRAGYSRGDKILVDTGRMRASVNAQASGNLLAVYVGADYAVHHQYGTRNMPQRQILPMESTGGLPPTWHLAVHAVAENVLTSDLAGKLGKLIK